MHIDGAFNRNNMRYHGVLSDGFVKSGFGKMSQRQPTEFSYGLDDNSLQIAAHCWQSAHIQGDGVGAICLQRYIKLYTAIRECQSYYPKS